MEEKQQVTVSFQLSKDEHTQVKIAAIQANMSLKDFLAKAALEAVQKKAA